MHSGKKSELPKIFYVTYYKCVCYYTYQVCVCSRRFGFTKHIILCTKFNFFFYAVADLILNFIKMIGT